MRDSVVLSFPYSAREHTNAYLASRPGRQMRWLVRAPGLFFGLCAAVATVLSTLNNESGYWIQALSVLGLCALWVGISPVLLKRFTIWRLRRDSRTDRRHQETRALSADGFFPTERWAEPIPWSEVGSVTETRQFILIEASSDEVSYIPKQALSQEQMSAVRSILTSHVPGTERMPFGQPNRRWIWRRNYGTR